MLDVDFCLSLGRVRTGKISMISPHLMCVFVNSLIPIARIFQLIHASSLVHASYLSYPVAP